MKFLSGKIGILLSLSLLWGCVNHHQDLQNFSVTITDEIAPRGLLPESFEITSQGQLIMLTNRYNDDKTLYQKNFFVELSKAQRDSVYQLLSQLTPNDLALMKTQPDDSVIYKITINWVKDQQRQRIHLTGNLFAPELMELIAYGKKLPDYTHHFKMKEAHYFNTCELCLGPKDYAKD